MIDLTTLEAFCVKQAATCSDWAAKTDAAVTAKAADARAHAGRAVTDALLKATPGRPTIAKARNSPSFMAACSRLLELSRKLRDTIADARERFYLESFDWHYRHVPEAIRLATPTGRPTQANISWTHSLTLYGETLETTLGRAIRTASEQLLSALSRIGNQAALLDSAIDLLDDWERRTAGQIGQVARSLLTDSQILIDRKAGRDVVDPIYLLADPTLPS